MSIPDLTGVTWKSVAGWNVLNIRNWVARESFSHLFRGFFHEKVFVRTHFGPACGIPVDELR
jgi:hypothetical protein